MTDEPDSGAADADLRERLVERQDIYRGRYLTVHRDTVRRSDGSTAIRDVCGHPGAVAILALDDRERLLMVRQWRHPAGQALLEIPAGTLDVDGSTGVIEDPDVAARRELEEETGYRADEWQLLTRFFTAPGFASELMSLYLATGLHPAHEDPDRLGPDEDERLRLQAVPWRDAVAAAERGEIRDAKSLVGLLWFARLSDGRARTAGPGAPTQPGTGRSPG